MTDSPDLISGHKEIGRFLGLSPRQVSWHDERGHLPTFKIGRMVFARKAKLIEWIEDQERVRQTERENAAKKAAGKKGILAGISDGV